MTRPVGRFLFGGGGGVLFTVRWTKGILHAQQNMDDRICVSCSCFGLHAFLPSVNIFEKANESIRSSKSFQNFQTSILNFQELLCLTVTG